MGTKDREGFLKLFMVYALLICIGFIYLYPILHMVSTSFMTLDDLLDSSIKWLPSSLNLSNYKQAAASMKFWSSLGQSIIIAGVPTICNLISCSIIGYGLAIWAFILPSMVGQGINAPIFILIFWQFFRQIPKVLIEASKIDGAGYFESFYKVALPSAKPAFITVALFSFVWYWNESYLTNLYVRGIAGQGMTSLVLQLQNFASNYSTYSSTAVSGATSLNESINMAGTMLTVLPLMLLYFVLQKQFVESIDRAGITGE